MNAFHPIPREAHPIATCRRIGIDRRNHPPTTRPGRVARLSRLAFGFAVAVWAATSSSLSFAQHHVPVTLDELVDGSASIVEGTLISAQPRWNDKHNLILTDYRFRAARVLIDGGVGAGEFVVTQAGGTLDGETHKLSSNPELFVGERYLAFLDPQANRVFCPFLGGDQGVYRIDGDVASALSGRQTLPLDALIARVDARVQKRGNAPPRFRHAGPPAGVTYPAKTAVPFRAPFAPPAANGSLAPLQQQAAPSPEARDALAAPVVDPQPESPTSHAPTTPNWHRFAIANRPIVWDEWPHDWWVSPHDQYMMSTWNGIADNLNRVSGAELGTWSWGNGRFEMVGWPDNDTMIAQFGEGWGATTLAITWSRWNGSGVILESDIALNPAYCWTLDESRSANGSDTCWGVDQSTLHELGHAWGLAHPWESENVWWDSVMNYAPKEFRLPFLHEDDTDAARVSYPGATIDLDGLVSLYQTQDNANSMHATYTSAFPWSTTIYHGQTLTLGNIQVENPGTLAFADPSVEIYLAQNWRSWSDSYYFLRTASYGITVDPSTTRGLIVNPTTIPDTMPTGRYYPSIYLRLDGDQSTGNNTAASSPNVTATIRNVAAMLDPIDSWRTWSLGRIGPMGSWELLLPVVAGDDYELSLCGDLGGGSADFDTVLEVVGVTSNDDDCGFQSHVLFTSNATTTRTISIRGYDLAAQGAFTLAYRRIASDAVFQDGFD